MNVWQKTFGGLSATYYIRQFLFGLIIPAMLWFIGYVGGSNSNNVFFSKYWLYISICQLLYPYSRFVYESIVEYIVGKNVFFVNALLMLLVKLVTMLLCWTLAVFIAPVGLIYLYFYHSRQEKLPD